MRPITKILLLLVVAFLTYLVWPRSADLKAFKPEELAKLQVEAWRAEKAGKGFDALLARFRINTSQYSMSPVAAFQMARSQALAWEQARLAIGEAGDPAAENRALVALTERYSRMKGQVGGEFDPDALAREDFAGMTLTLSGAPSAEVAAPLARRLAAIYGGTSEDFADVAANLAEAQVLVFSGGDEGPGGEASADEYAREGCKLLKEVAMTPVPTAVANE